MILVKNKEECCGCTACYSVCPTKAIVMKEDEKGFFYPDINSLKCIKCNACVKVCPLLNKEVKRNIIDPKLYAFQHNDVEIVNNSSSGGAFTAFSDVILSKGGVVVGAVMNDDFNVFHIVTEKSHVRNKMRRSKYVESKLNNIFCELLPYLKKTCHYYLLERLVK